MQSDGFVGAVQMTLSHDDDFEIALTDQALVADYRTNGNKTTLIIVAPEGIGLFTAAGDFEIEEAIAATTDGYVESSTMNVPVEFKLSSAYPNPFNPVTNMDIAIPEAGYVSVKIYNLVGQVIDVLHDGYMEAGYHGITWDAADASSGLYLVRVETGSHIGTQKLMLLK